MLSCCRGPLAASILLLAWALPPPEAQAQDAATPAGVSLVAVVNGEPIFSDLLEARIAEFRRSLPPQVREQFDAIEIYQRVLKLMIDERLQLQRALQRGLRVNEIEVTQQIERILQGTNQTWEQALRNSGMDEERFREAARIDLLISRALIADNQRSLRIEDTEINQLLRERLGQRRLREYLIEHAIFTNEQRLQAEELSAASSADFLLMAESTTTSLNPVNLGWLQENQVPALYLEELRGMRPGEVSGVLEFSNGLHVIHLLAQRPVVPGQARSGEITAKMLRVPATEADVDDLEDEVALLKLAQTSFEELQEKYAGEVVTVERLIENMPASIRNGLRLRYGEIAGPFAVGDTLVIVKILAIKQMVIGDPNYRQRAAQALVNENLVSVRRKWIEHLRSIGTVEIIRAEP